MHAPRRILLPAALSICLSACGFHLQGRSDDSPALEPVYLQVPDDATPLARELNRSLQVAAVALVTDAESARAILEIVSDDTGRTVESVTAQNRPREYRIFYRATYRVISGGKVILENQRVIRTRVYTYDETKVLAKAHEEDILRTALAKEIAGVITRRLANVEAPAT